MSMEKVVVYYAMRNNGDGSASLVWFLTAEQASAYEESQYEGWGEDCTDSVETFVGSDIYEKALKNKDYVVPEDEDEDY